MLTTHKISSLLTYYKVDIELKSSSGTRGVCIFPSHPTKVVLDDISNFFQEVVGQ